jgi:signal peptidase I
MNKIIKEFKSLLYLIIIVLFLKETVVELYIVPTSSMERNILRGDMLVGSRYIYGMKVPQKIWVPFTAISIPTFLPDYRFPRF